MTDPYFENELRERFRRAAKFAGDPSGAPQPDLAAPAGKGRRSFRHGLLLAGVAALLVIVGGGAILALRSDPTEVVTTDNPTPTATGPTTTGLEAVPAAECSAAVSPPAEVWDLGPVDGFAGMKLLAFQRDGSAFVQAFVNGIYTEPAELTGILEPQNLRIFGTYDLNVDGEAEILLNGIGNTARNVVILQTNGCDLVAVGGDDTSGDVFQLLIGVGGNSCAPTGCPVRVRCVGDELETSILVPDESVRGQSVPANEAPVVITTIRYRLVPGRLDLLGEKTVAYPAFDNIPENAPSFADSDIIDCPPGTLDAATTTRGPSASAPPSLAPGVGEAAEALVQDFLADLRHGEFEAAAGRWTGYPDIASGTPVIDRLASIEALVSNSEFASILHADVEIFVNASWGWTTATPVVTVFAGADGQHPAAAVGFLVGFSDEQGEPGRMWIQRLPTADNQSGEIQSTVDPGGQVTLRGVPVEGGARAYLNETEIPVVVDHSNLTTTITIPDTAEGTVAITLSTATPELPAVQTFVLTISAR